MKRGEFFLFVAVLVLALRFYFFYIAPKPFKDGDEIRVVTTIRSEPVIYDNAQYLRIYGLKTYLPLYPRISYGDKLTIEGKVAGEKLAEVKLIEAHENDNIIYKFRKRLLSFYQKTLPMPHSSLLAGVTIGSKSGISQDFWDKLKNSGTAHVVVASGMNVTLVAGFLINFLTLFLKRKKALTLALCGVWVYAVMAGFDAPIVRASVMGSIAFIAQELGRLSASMKALIFSALVMLLINPGYIEDAGFLLSFFATLGLIVLEPRIRKKISFVPRGIREDLSTTLAAQIGVFPFLYYFFGRVSLMSPIVNTLVLWTVVPVTLMGMVGGLVGLIFEPIGTGILWLTYPLTSWFVFIVQLFG